MGGGGRGLALIQNMIPFTFNHLADASKKSDLKMRRAIEAIFVC